MKKFRMFHGGATESDLDIDNYVMMMQNSMIWDFVVSAKMKESVSTAITQANSQGLHTVSLISDKRYQNKILCSFTIDQTIITIL